MHIRQLPPALKPLADKFYRSQRAVIGKTTGAQIWVAQETEIIAALVLHPVADGYWLTSLLVDARQRKRGIARQLISTVRSECGTKVWLFCHPDLYSFYTRLGFETCQQLPPELAARLTRYQQSKPLRAMILPS
jgi:N-acetylglutamate synthase-like GNAT family acetyltransferase